MENKNINKEPSQPWADKTVEEREDLDIEIDEQFTDFIEPKIAESDFDNQSLGDSDGEDSRDTSPIFSTTCRTKRVLTSSGSESSAPQQRKRDRNKKT